MPFPPLTRSSVDQTIQARFEQVAQHIPEHLALTDNSRRWTYGALNQQANRLAHAILDRTRPGRDCVALLLDHSGPMVVAALAVLKAGKVYVALHPGMPPAAQGETVRHAAPALILTTEDFCPRARALAADVCDVLVLEHASEDGPTTNPDPVVHPADPATIFFTSGTTGPPKGVVRSHRAVVHRAWLSQVHEAVGPGDRQSLLTHCSFANAQADLAGALLNGATLCVFDVMKEGFTAFGSWIDRDAITLLRPPVQLFRRFLATLDAGRVFPSVRLVSLGGDRVQPEDLGLWKRHFVRPSALLHRISTTETTLLTSDRFDHDTPIAPDVFAASTPVADKHVTIVDGAGRPVPTGEVGELVVTSAFLSDGYWRRPDDTRRAFSADPDHPDRRSYRTGDLGRLQPDGRFVLLGRRDHQVKIRGYRVEITEVEAALGRLDDIAEAAVVAVTRSDEQRLLAYVVMRADRVVDTESVKHRLGAVLPAWKVPAHIITVPRLPTMFNGKVDRQRLAEDARTVESVRQAPPQQPGVDAPSGELEEQVAAIFQSTLRCGPVARSDDFFLLGGDSLKATVLHLQLECIARVPIPLETLVADATVASIADRIRQARQSWSGQIGRAPLLVPLRKTGGRPPLFLVHGRLGQAFMSPYFLEVLGPDQPVYAFQANGLDRSLMPRNTIQEMASQYVRAMRAVQPAGPYFLGAACAGGLVVTEMANQLRRAGDAVGPLLMVDPVATPAGDRPWWIRRLKIAWLTLQRLGIRPLTGAPAARMIRLRARLGRIALDAADPAAVADAASAAVLFEIARLKYRRWHYDGPVLMLRSSERMRIDGPDRRGPFSRHLTGDVRWFDIGGTHAEVRRPGHEGLPQALRDAVAIVHSTMAEARGTR